ncbi:MAG TPA: GNAT family N-acetyltransferase [Chthoniobacterales bacterium]|nr:GNAT family N-acetyltransferase [Chthoniobacterales bacterium]
MLQTAPAANTTLPLRQTQRGYAIPFPGGIARIVDHEGLQRIEAWPAAFESKAKDHRFYEIVDQTLDCGFEHHYLVLEDEAGVVHGVQPVFFVRQNLVEGVPAVRSVVETIRRPFPRFLTMRILMVGCAAGEGHLGVCKRSHEEWVAKALHSTLRTYARRSKAGLVVFKDFSARYRTALRNVSSDGFTRVPSMPMTRLALRYRDCDDYLRSLGKATRKDLRRKFRKVEKAAAIALDVVTDVSPIVDELYPLYLQVHERSPMKFERLTKDYFRSLGALMPDKVRFFVWRQEGRIVAFSVALVHDATIYDDYLGLDYRVALDLHLYFHTFLDIIRWSLAQGLRWYCSSPLNYKPKLHLGCELMPLDLYVMHTSPVLNRLFRPALKFLEPTRHDPVLQRFPNAHEL